MEAMDIAAISSGEISEQTVKGGSRLIIEVIDSFPPSPEAASINFLQSLQRRK